ncbi:MAG: thioredoxin family protein [Gammaproteobacteria bacterium]|jgi:thioredoxin 1
MSLPSLDQFNYHHTLEETPGVALVCFTSPACGSCKAFRRALEQFIASWTDVAVFEIDAQMNPALVNELGFFHLPTLYLYRDGEFHRELQPQPSPKSIRDAIDTALRRPAMEAP